jgi:hypothetical protein
MDGTAIIIITMGGMVITIIMTIIITDLLIIHAMIIMVGNIQTDHPQPTPTEGVRETIQDLQTTIIIIQTGTIM